MVTVHKNKKGFTLLEMMLSIAIITIVSGCLVSLMIGIKDSYINTYNSDDSTDYAMLFAQGLENSVLATVQDQGAHPVKTAVWKVGTYTGDDGATHTALMMNGTPVFKLKQMQVQPKGKNKIVDKWSITLEFDPTTNITASNVGPTKGMINYTITVRDNYYDPQHPIKCVHNGGFLLPHFDNGTVTATATELTFKAS